MSVKIEITLSELLDSYDWAEVFGEGGGGNCNNETDACPPNAEIDCSPPVRSDVVEIIAAVNGENDGPEWIGVFRLRDGRFLVAEGSCDYTGWDCQAGNSMQVAASLVDAIQFGLTPERQDRLGLTLNSLPNSDRDAFLKALSENEDDVTTRLVYADWLDENGQPEEADRQRKWNAAKAWLVEFGRTSHRDYAALLEIGQELVADGGAYVGDDDAQDLFNDHKREFVENVSIVLGKSPPDADDVYFRCAC